MLREKPSSTNPFDSDSDSDGDNGDSISSTEQFQRTPPTARQTSPAAASFLNSVSSAAKSIMSKNKFDFGALQRKLSSNSLFDSVSESEVKLPSTPPIKHLSNGSRDKENVRPCTHVHVPSVEKRIDLESQSPQEMEKSLVHKAEEATARFRSMMSKKFDFSALQRKLSSNALLDSDSESELKSSFTTSIKHLSNSSRDKENVTPPSSCSNSSTSMARSELEKRRRDPSDLENQSPQKLEDSLVHKAEEATSRFKNCLKIAEEISQSGAYALAALENQGEQITQTHLEAAKMEDDLSKGEKLLGSLGGLFSKPWTPKKTRSITGTLTTRYYTSNRAKYIDQTERTGSARTPNRQKNLQQISTDKSSPCDEIEEEMAKQDDTIADLSNLLGQIKSMAIDMGSELGRQNSALNHLHDDVDELEYRVHGANLRGRRLLGK